jgi:aryl-alcohol dehydrogenase-like predicted oxidoreductase
VRSGKVRYIGFSNWSAWQVSAAMEMMEANGLAPFSHGQMYYSLLGRDIEHEFVAMLRHYGLGLTTWSPLSGGTLTGKYRQQMPGDSRLETMDMMPVDGAAAERALVQLAQVAIAWLLAKSDVTSVILGAAKPPQLEDNLGAADIALSAEEVAALDSATAPAAPYPAWFLHRYGDKVLERALGAC